MPPITWKNISAPDFSGALKAQAAAGEQLSTALDPLKNVITAAQERNDANFTQIGKNNTAAQLAKLRGLTSLADYNAAKANFDPTSIQDQFGMNIDQAAIDAASLKRQGTLRTDAINTGLGNVTGDTVAAQEQSLRDNLIGSDVSNINADAAVKSFADSGHGGLDVRIAQETKDNNAAIGNDFREAKALGGLKTPEQADRFMQAVKDKYGPNRTEGLTVKLLQADNDLADTYTEIENQKYKLTDKELAEIDQTKAENTQAIENYKTNTAYGLQPYDNALKNATNLYNPEFSTNPGLLAEVKAKIGAWDTDVFSEAQDSFKVDYPGVDATVLAGVMNQVIAENDVFQGTWYTLWQDKHLAPSFKRKVGTILTSFKKRNELTQNREDYLKSQSDGLADLVNKQTGVMRIKRGLSTKQTDTDKVLNGAPPDGANKQTEPGGLVSSVLDQVVPENSGGNDLLNRTSPKVQGKFKGNIDTIRKEMSKIKDPFLRHQALLALEQNPPSTEASGSWAVTKKAVVSNLLKPGPGQLVDTRGVEEVLPILKKALNKANKGLGTTVKDVDMLKKFLLSHVKSEVKSSIKAMTPDAILEAFRRQGGTNQFRSN